MGFISLDHANAIFAGAFSKSAELGLKPLTVAVLDAGGHVIALQRQDGSSTLRPQIACGKASSALSLGLSTRKIGEMALERPAFVSSLSAIAPQGIIPAAGGVLVVDAEGRPIGAVGVTGDTSDNDEICALSGIAAAGLNAQT
ncbi:MULTISPECIES: GlcG/HbpS family heme-binding protein [unclassified Sphingobium]|uniref:GlcG/HbpS family heme-binding protein n=1 Tax=unclassified Sphingobium TaxID=2611147 RepID=UPI0009E76833|nr:MULTISPECIES: heme-binding protein [Sphingomonadaceae]NML91977.1 heme-binding protein [Sphingobium sp. TB-6]